MKILNNNITQILKDAQQKKGISRYELAEKVNKKRSYI